MPWQLAFHSGPVLLISLCIPSLLAQDAQHFQYRQHGPPGADVSLIRREAQFEVHEVFYKGANGGRVPGYLVEPNKEGKFAAVIWGHWMMPGSPSATRKEFLDEAIAIAPAGVVSLLIDAPYVRPGFKPDPQPLSSQEPDVIAQQVIDLRRGVDMLSALHNIDANRIAYVGHSFDAGTGAILDAVDKRLRAFVFMGGPQSVRHYILNSNTRDAIGFRNSVPRAQLIAFLTRYAWADPGTYVKQLGPAPAFFQYALRDDYVPVAEAKHFYEMSSGPKRIKSYDATHALNAQARRDRFDFLREHLKLANLPAGVLDSVPQTK